MGLMLLWRPLRSNPNPKPGPDNQKLQQRSDEPWHCGLQSLSVSVSEPWGDFDCHQELRRDVSKLLVQRLPVTARVRRTHQALISLGASGPHDHGMFCLDKEGGPREVSASDAYSHVPGPPPKYRKCWSIDTWFWAKGHDFGYVGLDKTLRVMIAKSLVRACLTFLHLMCALDSSWVVET